MNNSWKLSQWITRLLLVPPALIFTLVGIRGLTHLTSDLGARGIAFTSGLGITTGQVGFGAFPLACALFLIGCLFSERLLPVALAFVGTLDSVVLAVRVISMRANNSTAGNMRIVVAEIILLALVAAGSLIELARRRANTPAASPASM